MSKYTIEIRKIINMVGREEVENWFKDYQLTDYLTENQIETINNHGLWTKEKLARKIVDHYFMQEIGFETIALFKHYAKVTMQEIMEEKLPLIYSNAIEYDPLINVDFTESFEREVTGETSADSNSTLSSTILNSGTNSNRVVSNSENEINSENENTLTDNSSVTANSQGSSNSSSNSSSESLKINNQTPQTIITKQNLNNGFYASSVEQSENSSTATDVTTNTSSNSTTSQDTQRNAGSGSSTETSENTTTSQGTIQNTNTNNAIQNSESSQDSLTKEKYTRKQKGNSGSLTTAQNLIMQYRKNIIAIDKEIIEELSSLFMSLF